MMILLIMKVDAHSVSLSPIDKLTNDLFPNREQLISDQIGDSSINRSILSPLSKR